MSKKPLAYPTIRLDASGESFDELTHVDIIQNMMAYSGIWCCPKCHKEFTVSACMCFSSRLELLM